MHHFCSHDQTNKYPNTQYLIDHDMHWNAYYQSSLSSPHRRHDSLAFSPSVPMGFTGSPRQAEPQPRRNTTVDVSTATECPGLPVNDSTTRSISHHSSLPRTQPQHHYDIHRASRGSFEGALPYIQPNMTRSYSRRSESLDTMPQLRQVPSPLTPPTWHASQQSNLSQDLVPERTSIVPTSPYEFGLDEIIGSGNGERYLGLEMQRTE